MLISYFYSDLEGIYNAIIAARAEKSKPTLIRLRTTIGYGSKQQGTHGVHGAREYFPNANPSPPINSDQFLLS